jgi:hypothetical protein
MNWNERCLKSIREEKQIGSERYHELRLPNIEETRGRTLRAIGPPKEYPWKRDCQGKTIERKIKTHCVKCGGAIYDNVDSKKDVTCARCLMMPNPIEQWKEKLGIEPGMSKEQALQKFLEWQSDKKTCQRCVGEQYVSYCPIYLVCKEAMDYEQRDVEGDDNGRGVDQAVKVETDRASIFEGRKRDAFRQTEQNEASLS